MLAYKEMDNLAAVEIEISGRVATAEFDKTAKKLEAFIKRHGRVRFRHRSVAIRGCADQAVSRPPLATAFAKRSSVHSASSRSAAY